MDNQNQSSPIGTTFHKHNGIDSPTIPASNISGLYQTIQTYTPAAAGTATIRLNASNVNHITMPAGNITIAIDGARVGQFFIIRIQQDSVGSRTVTWFSTIRWNGSTAPTLSTAANKADTIGFEVTGIGTYDGVVVMSNL